MLNDRQKASLRISILPIVVLISLVLGVGYFLLKGELKLPKFNKGPTFQKIEGFPTVIYLDEDIEKERKVITSEQELNEFLNKIDKTGLLTVKEKIDFDKKIVLAVSTDTHEETGRKIKIKKISEDKEKKKMLVEFEETVPEKDCNMEKDKNIAVDMVILSKTNYRINFEKITKVIMCDDTEIENDEINEVIDNK